MVPHGGQRSIKEAAGRRSFLNDVTSGYDWCDDIYVSIRAGRVNINNIILARVPLSHYSSRMNIKLNSNKAKVI